MIEKQTKRKITASSLIKPMISVGIILFLLRYAELPLIISSLKRINLWLFTLSLLILPLSILIRSYRWQLILNTEKAHISLKDAFALTWIGCALNLVFPFQTGEIARAYYGYKKLGLKEEMLSSIIADRMVGLLAIAIVGGVSAVMYTYYPVALFCLVMSILLAIFVYIPRTVPWKFVNLILRFLRIGSLDHEGLIAGATMPLQIKVATMSLSLIGWMIAYYQFYLIIMMFHLKVQFLYLLTIAPLITITSLFPIGFSGVGLTNAAIVYLLNNIGITVSHTLIISLFYSLLLNVVPGLVGYVLILMPKTGETTHNSDRWTYSDMRQSN